MGGVNRTRLKMGEGCGHLTGHIDMPGKHIDHALVGGNVEVGRRQVCRDRSLKSYDPGVRYDVEAKTLVGVLASKTQLMRTEEIHQN